MTATTPRPAARPVPIALLLAMLLFAGVAFIMNRSEAAGNAPADQDWPLHGRDAGEQRFSPLAQVNRTSVKALGVAWYADFNGRSLRGVEGTPIVVDGVMYASGPWSRVLALDARTGKLLWSYDPEMDGAFARKACCDVVNRGVAVARGKVMVGVVDGRLIALDAKTGKVAWSVVTVDQTKSYSITGAPRIVKNLVVIGNGGAEYGVRGYVTAYDIDTGKQVWRFYLVPGNPKDGFEDKAQAMAAKTWTGEWWRWGGGGTAWDSMSYDPELDLLYIGAGNASPWNRKVSSPGGGDNLFLSSIVAVKPETGEYVWHFQEVPGDEWDYTATQHMILADLDIGGRMRKVIMQAPKNGYFYILDRRTGEFLSGTPYTPLNWSRGLDPKTGRADVVPEARYSETGKLWVGKPAPPGGHGWQPMSYDPRTGLVYIPEIDMSYPYVAEPAKDFSFNPHGWNTGQDPEKSAMPEDIRVRAAIRASVTGKLMAWDPKARKEVWSVPMSSPWNGGVLSTAGGLVFQGNGAGYFAAYDAKNGAELWSTFMDSGIVAPPITYSIDGEQYVAIPVGYGGNLTLNVGEVIRNTVPPRVNRIVVFKLGGKAVLPKVEVAKDELPPAPPGTASAEVVAAGHRQYHISCWMCHGDSAVNHGGVPDLRKSGVIGDKDTFRAIVLEGALEPAGMPSFAKELTSEQVEAVRAYVVKRANDLRRDIASGAEPAN